MIHPLLRRKKCLTLLMCFLILFTASISKQSSVVYAKKANSETVEVKKQDYNNLSKKELTELVKSLKETIDKLDSRILNIETKLGSIAIKSSEKETSKITDQWVSFSTKDQTETQTQETNNKTPVKASEPDKNISKTNKEVSKTETTDNDSEKILSDLPKINDKADKMFLADDQIKNNEKNIVEVSFHKPATNKIDEKTDLKPETKTVAVNDRTETKEVTTKTSSNESKAFSYNITVKKEIENGYEVGSINIGGKKVIAYRSEAGGIDPFARAQIVAKRLEAFIGRGGDAKQIQPALHNGLYIGSINGNVLFTVDHETAQKSGQNQQDLTLSWVNNIRSALGAPKVERSSRMLSSRSLSAKGRPISNPTRGFDRTRSSNIINMLLPVTPTGSTQTIYGGASWYGPYFHGRRAADGSRYNMHEMTAAHKSLPFGTIVKVTNLNNNKTCVVKITDRGPYIHGRIIDLSKAAAQQVGMLSSGTAKVKVEILGKVPRFRR